MTPQVVRVGPEHLDDVAMVFARAFANEPSVRGFFPDERRRAVLVPLFGAATVHLAYLDGKIIESTPSLACLCIWTRPGQATSCMSWLRSAPRLLRMLRRASPGDVRRFVSYFTRLENRRHELVPQPHFSLDALAVSPERQRFGLGAVLVRYGLDRAERLGVPTYVETDGEDKAVFYGKLGFELAEHVEDYPPMNIPTWRMIRQPQTAGPAHSQTMRPEATAST